MDEQQKHDDDAIDISMPGFSGSVDKQTTQTVLSHIGPHLKWLVYALGYGVAFWMTMHGVSLIWD